LVTGAAGQIAYSLVFMIASGDMLGAGQEVILHLLDIAPMKQAIDGLALELEDCAFPLLRGIVPTTDVRSAFADVDVAILVGAFPRAPGMQRKDLLEKNAGIFREQGQALNEVASRDVKVLVVGNPANTNALIAMSCAPRVPKENFTALTRLDQNRAVAQVAKKLNTNPCCVHNVIIWGNHSNTQYPDVQHAWVSRNDRRVDVRTAVNDDKWLHTVFVPAVQLRGAAVINARKKSSAGSAAVAIVDHVRTWLLGTKQGEIVSMGVASDGSYGIPPGVIYSLPVTCQAGVYKVVNNLPIEPSAVKHLRTTHEELLSEREAAFKFLGL